MDEIDMALDEIISKQKPINRGKRSAPRVDGPLSRPRPNRSDGGRGARNFAIARVGGHRFGFNKRSNENDVVWINIANLPDTVLTADLQELFQDFNVYGVGVHYNEVGQHMGTADLYVDTPSAQAILQEYANIAIDGVKIRFAIVNDNAMASPQFPNQRRTERPLIRKRSRHNFNDLKRSNSARSSRTYSRSRSPLSHAVSDKQNLAFRKNNQGRQNSKSGTRQVKTNDELDRELESYMKGNKHPRIKLEQ